MHKTKNKEVAESLAAEHSKHFGLCVFDGFFYVGTVTQLTEMGCVDIIGPTPNGNKSSHD